MSLFFSVNKNNSDTTFRSEFSDFLKLSQWTVTEECPYSSTKMLILATSRHQGILHS